jgi:hypothetical protein
MPSRRFRMARPTPPSSTDSDTACLVRPGSSSTSRATTQTVMKRSLPCSTPLRAKESRSWTPARGRPPTSKSRRRTTSAFAMITWSHQWSARRHAPRATRPSPVRQRTTLRVSCTRRACSMRSRQACTQGLPAHQELHQRRPQTKGGRSTQEGRVIPRQRRRSGGYVPR